MVTLLGRQGGQRAGRQRQEGALQQSRWGFLSQVGGGYTGFCFTVDFYTFQQVMYIFSVCFYLVWENQLGNHTRQRVTSDSGDDSESSVRPRHCPLLLTLPCLQSFTLTAEPTGVSKQRSGAVLPAGLEYIFQMKTEVLTQHIVVKRPSVPWFSRFFPTTHLWTTPNTRFET